MAYDKRDYKIFEGSDIDYPEDDEEDVFLTKYPPSLIYGIYIDIFINIKMYVRDNNISMFDKTNINKFIDFISLYTEGR